MGDVREVYRLPVLDELRQVLHLNTCLEIVILEGRHKRPHRGLRGHAGHRVDGRVDRVGARGGAREHGGDARARGVVRVNVNRKGRELTPKRRDEHGGRLRLQQPGHVLDAEHMRTCGDMALW